MRSEPINHSQNFLNSPVGCMSTKQLIITFIAISALITGALYCGFAQFEAIEVTVILGSASTLVLLASLAYAKPDKFKEVFATLAERFKGIDWEQKIAGMKLKQCLITACLIAALLTSAGIAYHYDLPATSVTLALSSIFVFLGSLYWAMREKKTKAIDSLPSLKIPPTSKNPISTEEEHENESEPGSCQETQQLDPLEEAFARFLYELFKIRK